jgi:NADH-quinone oxidoreductase subunit G
MADMITLTIDGRQVTVPAGTNVVDAAREVGIEIPVFCYHPRLKAVGMCRMCLVSVGMPRIDRATGQPVLDEEGNPAIAMMPKLQTACTTTVSQGMIVHTDTEEVKFAQRGVLEFLLTSHPLDCPVCDKGGECPLQNLTMEWGPGISEYAYSDKVHFEKPVPLGELIYLDRERCILCGRCVRFQDELANDPVLGFSERGRAWHIISESEPPFDSKFSGNTTDICPVGALTTRDFRFRARVWELKSIPSLCTHCSVGCNLNLDMRLGQINRVMPRENDAVNDIWICDKGRFAQRYVESDDRLTTPLIRLGNQHVEASWDEAIQVIVEKFATIHSKRTAGGSAFAGLAGERLSNEDLYLFQRLFRDVLGSNNLDYRAGTPADTPHDDLGVALGVGLETNLMSLGKGTTVLVIGADLEEEAPIYRQRLHSIAQQGGELLVANVRPTRLDHSATLKLHYQPGSEQQVARAILSGIYAETSIQRLPPRTTYNQADLRANLNTPVGVQARSTGLTEADIQVAVQRMVQAEHIIIVYGSDARALGTPFIQDLANILILLGKVGQANSGLLPILPRGNSRGALDMGIRSDYGPGYPHLLTTVQSGRAKEGAIERGLSTREMWGAALEGQIRAMYIAGLDPLGNYPAAQQALEKLEFLVVQDMFLTPTAQLADVVLPVAAFAERDGTYTNAERRVQRVRQARPAPGESRSDWAIIQDIAVGLAEQIVLPGQGEEATTDRQPAKAKSTRSRKGSDKPRTLLPWDYLDASDVAREIAEQIPLYQGITYPALANVQAVGSWGRQVNEPLFYEGTGYKNTDSVGIQYPAPAERDNATFTIKFMQAEPLPADRNYPFTLLVQPLLYDGDPLLRNSLLLAYVPEPYVVLNATDAENLHIQAGERVQITSSAGALELVARINTDIPAGSVLIAANLPQAPVAALQTGPRTRVAVQKKDGGA